MYLDVNTPKGQATLEDERRAVAMFEKRYRRYRFIHTKKDTMAKVDGLLLDGPSLDAVVLTSCRYKCVLETFQLNWDWEWLLTWRKVATGAILAKYLQTRLIGFLYIVEDNKLLVKTLFDGQKKRWCVDFRLEYSETQATVNGGRVVRLNAYIKMDKAIILTGENT